MNKTLYIKDEDLPIWDRARELAGDKLSPVIVEGLKHFIVKKEAEEVEAKGYERIQVSFEDSEDHGIPKIKSFHGKWIIPENEPVTYKSAKEKALYSFAVAVTAKGAAVFYWSTTHKNSSGYEYVLQRFQVYSSLEVAAAAPAVGHAARKAIEKRGIPVEELDI